MILAEFHTHTVFCDGKNTPEEIARAAVSMGLRKLGFSGHSHTPFDESYCMSVSGAAAYRAEVRRVKRAFADRLEIFCGVEQDYYSDTPTDEYDYVIGSVHYVRFGDRYVPVDEGNDNLQKAADAWCGGDVLSVIERYYETVGGVAEKTGCDIIGHFDLPTKYLERERLFDTTDPRYRAAWQKAADRLLKAGVPFEINTGAISRGVRTEPYPSVEILRYLASRGGTVVLSGDSHAADTLCFRFREAEALAAETGVPIRYPEKFGL